MREFYKCVPCLYSYDTKTEAMECCDYPTSAIEAWECEKCGNIDYDIIDADNHREECEENKWIKIK